MVITHLIQKKSPELPDWKYWYWRGTCLSCKSSAYCPKAFHRAAYTGLLFVLVLPKNKTYNIIIKKLINIYQWLRKFHVCLATVWTSKRKRTKSFFTGSAYRSSNECLAIKFLSTAKAKCLISWSSCRAKPTSRSRTPIRKCLRQNSLVSVYSGMSWNRMDKIV